MQTVMIVDDESIFREYLRGVLDWGTLGFEISAEAKNGVEALELCAANPVDIALIDITMPFMDGLKLTEKLKEQYPEMSIVLITGHNEFEYARTALKLGVEDYILKPFSRDELMLTLLKLQQEHQKVQKENFTYKENQQLVKESFLNQLISGDCILTDQEIRNRLEQYNIPVQNPVFVVACIEIDHIDRKWEKISERLLMKYAVTNILNETLDDSWKHHIFNGPEGRIIGLIEHVDHQNHMSTYLDGYRRLGELIKKYLNFTITIGIGRSKEGFRDIRESYQEALVALQSKFVLGHDRVITYESVAVEVGKQAFYPVEVNEELLIELRMRNAERVQHILDRVFDSILERRLSMDYVYVICIGLISVNLAYIQELGHPIEECFGENFFPYNEIRKFESLEMTFEWITELFHKAIRYTGQYKNTRAAKIAQSAKAYIEQCYPDPELQLEQVAQHVFINASYLRAVFKKEFGMTLSDYITQYRMKKAKEQLGQGGLRLSDIAESVGYSDAGYFSKSFKKFYGYSPSDYEKNRT
ncbi:response regulator [Paenibacillus sp. HW567]|uniref:response regulator n=1 Tax=Paenibacillus sp. HW567 TaxID=1034769 RepID=UPI00037A07D7|nr:response regulator [Paenibacillus sp. HW567]